MKIFSLSNFFSFLKDDDIFGNLEDKYSLAGGKTLSRATIYIYIYIYIIVDLQLHHNITR